MEEKKSVQNSSEEENRSGGVRISRIVAGICALLVAAAAGAAVVADKAFKDEAGARIYSSTSVAGAGKSSLTEMASSEAAEETEPHTDQSEEEPESAAEKRTRAAATAVVYEYPQDINEAGLDCLLAVNGINRTVAEGIVAYRSRRGALHNFQELLEIYGIGERTLTVIEEHFFISEDKQEEYTTAAQTTRAAETVSESTSRSAVPAVTELTETTAEPEPVMKPVNINKADAAEIAECLLLSYEQAEAVVKLRELIGSFSDLRELLYTDVISEQELAKRMDHILLE